MPFLAVTTKCIQTCIQSLKETVAFMSLIIVMASYSLSHFWARPYCVTDSIFFLAFCRNALWFSFHVHCTWPTFLFWSSVVLYGFVRLQRYFAPKVSESSVKGLSFYSAGMYFQTSEVTCHPILLLPAWSFCGTCSWGHKCRFSEPLIKPHKHRTTHNTP